MPVSEINPLETKYSITNHTYDSTNSRSHYFCQIADSETWVHYRTWQSSDGGEYSIKDMGQLDMVAPDLDTDSLKTAVVQNLGKLIRDDKDEWEDTDRQAAELLDDVDSVVDALETEWQHGAEEVVTESMYGGTVGVDSAYAWASHVEEAYYYEIKEVLRQHGIENFTHHVESQLRQSLSDVVQKRQNRWVKPHMEYELRINLE